MCTPGAQHSGGGYPNYLHSHLQSHPLNCSVCMFYKAENVFVQHFNDYISPITMLSFLINHVYLILQLWPKAKGT